MPTTYYAGQATTNQPGVITIVPGLKTDVSDQLFLLDRNANPLTYFLTTIGKSMAPDGQAYNGKGVNEAMVTTPEFEYYEDTIAQDTFVIAGGASTTTVTVDEGALSLCVGDELLSEADEILLVTAVASDTSITVARGFAGTTTVDLVPDESLVLISSVKGEGAGSYDSSFTKKNKMTGYCQIVETAIEISNTAKESSYYTGDEYALQKEKHAIQQALKIEGMMLFSKGGAQMVDGKLGLTSHGLIDKLANNDTPLTGGSITEAQFTSYLEDLFTYSSPTGKKLLLAGGKVMSDIQNFVGYNKGTQIQAAPGVNKLGVNIKEYESAFGTVDIVRHPLLRGFRTNIGIGLDMETVALMYVNNRKGLFIENIQNNDVDGRADKFLSQVGLRLTNIDRNRTLSISS